MFFENYGFQKIVIGKQNVLLQQSNIFINIHPDIGMKLSTKYLLIPTKRLRLKLYLSK